MPKIDLKSQENVTWPSAHSSYRYFLIFNLTSNNILRHSVFYNILETKSRYTITVDTLVYKNFDKKNLSHFSENTRNCFCFYFIYIIL